jgi:flagellar biosynthesis GTPase FlhF
MTDEVSGQTNTDSAGENQTANAESESNTLLTEQQTQEGNEEANTESNEAENNEGKEEGEGESESESQVPESYEFTMPEGMELDTAMAEAATPVFKELGLNQEQANKLTEVYAGQIAAQAKAHEDAFNDQLQTWATELKNDKDVGGEAFEKNTSVARLAIEKLGSPELMQLLDSTGVGNNPAMFKFALGVGKLLAEDQPGSGNPSNQDVPVENRLYPNEATK